VIFILLLFFLLSSTFTRFGEISLATSPSSGHREAYRRRITDLPAAGGGYADAEWRTTGIRNPACPHYGTSPRDGGNTRILVSLPAMFRRNVWSIFWSCCGRWTGPMSRSLAEPLGRAPAAGDGADPLIALINVVFLLLVFLMVAGTIAPRLSGDVTLIDASDPAARTPPDAAVILPDGRMMFEGAEVTAEAYAGLRLAAGNTEIRIVPDRNLPATDLIDLVERLRAAGATDVWIVTERRAE
jgi:biopolymer transport protein ExbD